MITKEDILKELQSLVGEKVENYKVSNVIRKILEQLRGNVYQTWSWNHNHQNIWFSWYGSYIINIDYKKKQGEKHHTWYSGSYTDYTFKEFEVSICGADTLEEAIEKAEENHKKYQQLKKENSLKSMEMLELLMKTYPDIDKYNLYSYINNIKDNFYTFFDKIKEKEAGN